MDGPPIRDAATFVLVRDPLTDPKVLLGRRQTNAVFMPDRFVFPGGAVDPGDAMVALAGDLGVRCTARLQGGSHPPLAYAAAAIRELWEETGLAFGHDGALDAPPGWSGFGAGGVCPSVAGMALIFRAITPPGRTRRFDARFFLADAEGLMGDPDRFDGASGELSDLAWVGFDRLDALNIAPVTQAALDVVAGRLPDLGPPPDLVIRGAGPHQTP